MKYLFPILIVLFFVSNGCEQALQRQYEAGVSFDLAQYRVDDISGLEYHLAMDIPDSIDEPISAMATISLFKKDGNAPLVFDFVTETNHVGLVKVNHEKVFFSLQNEHLIIPGNYVRTGENKIEIHFIMGEGALNRNKDYLYTLFVPDRARTVIPCFDQPDLKGKVSYSIKMPNSWEAITNGKEDSFEQETDDVKRVTFAQSKPISTYLWSFAAGKFKKISKKENGFEISLYHMEADSAKLARNSERVFDQVYHSLSWLEAYTHIKFPFQKYDLVCIPSFQFAGMEHPGATYYRQDMLFLSENPTQQQVLKRAQLLAHETAHMWFGDLVTMQWFSGVWQKEVFANFIADKMVKEQFPALNHDLTFLINHFPNSFSVDRTIAANPIQQQLGNLQDAGSMYGTIIYHKAPIVMNQLEKLIGEELLQKGLSKYLKQYSYSNASWADLMKILNDLSEYDLELWSRNWVNDAGRPVIEFVREDDELFIQQRPEYGDSSKVWAQRLKFREFKGGDYEDEILEILSGNQRVASHEIDFILPSIDATGYGLFLFDPLSLQYALNNVYIWDDNLVQGATLIHLFENFLSGNITPKKYLGMLKQMLMHEDNEQLLTLVCQQLREVYWRFVSLDQRKLMAEGLESILLDKMTKENSLSVNKLMVKTWSELVSTPKGLKKLRQVILKKKDMAGVKLSDRDLSDMAFYLAMKDPRLNDSFILSVSESLVDLEVKGMMNFVSPVFSDESLVLEKFVEDLNKEENRKRENWVLAAMAYIHHPYRCENNIRYLTSALELTQRIKETGSLFFPMRWVDTALGGYGSVEALKMVDYFFKDNPQFPDDLKAKVLQSLDMVERSQKLGRNE